jgi:seryl-tRNA synthetase
MLDLKFIRENIEAIRANCKNRNIFVELDKFSELDELRRKGIAKIEDLRHEQNENANAMKAKLSEEARRVLIDKGKDLKQRAVVAEEASKKAEDELDALVRRIPNMTHPDAPIAAGEDGNREIRTWGEKRKFDFKPLDHVEIGERLSLIDFESGAKVAGQKFYYLKNEAVLMEQALICFCLHLLRAEGFTPIMTPDLARASILDGIGFSPRGDETQIYSIANSDLCLIATAEITLGGMMSGEIIPESDLPLKFVGVSHCFRTEAGAAGRESKGLYRVHQFTKVEMFAFTRPEDSEDMHSKFVGLEEKIFQGLKIPYRVVDICTGDLGGPAYRKFDLEAWMPGRGEAGMWGEVTSTSNCTDYQSRRLGVKFRRENGKKTEFVHMLNGTAVAVSRVLIAILENYQQKDGKVLVPDALRPYMGGVERIDGSK